MTTMSEVWDENPQLVEEAKKEFQRRGLANALIIVDVQNDFCPGGSLAVEGGDTVAAKINAYCRAHEDDYKLIVATLDYHPTPELVKAMGKFAHFSDTPDFRESFPPHCVQGTEGARLHPNLNATAKNYTTSPWDEPTWPPRPGQFELDLVFYKGQNTAAFSGFEGNSMPSGLYDPPMGWTLDAYLKDKGVGHIDVVGLATDFCDKATAIDGVKLGYDVTVLLDMCAAVTPDGGKDAVADMLAAGIHVE